MALYFFDSYAVIEVMRGNPQYARFVNEEVILTIFNLVEIYWSTLNDIGESAADEIFEMYRSSVAEVDDETLKEAIKFRKEHKKRNLSYADCIGYSFARKHNLKFLTGDKEFEDMSHVEFVK